MKKNLLSKMFVATSLSLCTLTSCDPVWERGYYYDYGTDMDIEQSIAFAGQWTGNFGAFYNYNYYSQTYTFYSYDTNVIFYPAFNGATYGWGKEVDFYDEGPYTYIYNKFNWQITDGIVYLTYYQDSDMDCWIRDYRMTSNYFSGYFGNSSNSFRLAKIADYYDWTPYIDTYSYGERRDWFSSYNSRSMTISGDSIMTVSGDSIMTVITTSTTSDSIKANGIIKMGNRYCQ